MVELTVIGSALLGAVFGSIGTYILQRKKENREQENQAQRLRKGLLSDLKSMGFFRDWREYYDPGRVPSHEIASTIYFESIASEIGYLSEPESECVTEFYSKLTNANHMVDWNYNLTHDITTTPELTINPKAGIRRNKKLLETIDSVAESRKDLIETLENRL